MKLLYISCHSVLEYDELKLFSELGIDIFSHGCYKIPSKPGDPKRPGIQTTEHPELIKYTEPDDKMNIPKELFDWSDTVLFMHKEDWLFSNWPNCMYKRVIFRSIGQSTLNVENVLASMRREGLEIVRYSPREATIPNYQGCDAMIRFYKDENEFNNWTGEDDKIITIGQSMLDRQQYCGYNTFDRATSGFKRVIYGEPSKQPDPLFGGKLEYEKMKEELRKSRVYFYTGTYPASYTLNFMEAFMTGIPVVAVGSFFGNSPHELGQRTYEIPDIINNGVNGFFSDSIDELRMFIEKLMKDRELAQKIGEEGRKTAIELFAKEKIKKQWKEYLNA